MRALSRLYNPIAKFSEFFLETNQKVAKFQTRVFSLSHKVCKVKDPNWGSKKQHRNVKLQLLQYQKMADPKIEEILAPLRQNVKEQVS